MTPATAITPETKVSELAVTRAGASRVFQRHGIDFCCRGDVSLREACARKGVDTAFVISEIEAAERRDDEAFERWDENPLATLIEHILSRYHEGHRQELPRLLEMTGKVEHVHADKASCPRGLHAHLTDMARALEEHMQKEEQVLFPMIRAGRGPMVVMPVSVMREEHIEHGRNLEELRRLAHDYVPPADACGTWRALYLGLAELESELMQHIHLENNVLFPRALRGER